MEDNSVESGRMEPHRIAWNVMEKSGWSSGAVCVTKSNQFP